MLHVCDALNFTYVESVYIRFNGSRESRCEFFGRKKNKIAFLAIDIVVYATALLQLYMYEAPEQPNIEDTAVQAYSREVDQYQNFNVYFNGLVLIANNPGGIRIT